MNRKQTLRNTRKCTSKYITEAEEKQICQNIENELRRLSDKEKAPLPKTMAPRELCSLIF